MSQDGEVERLKLEVEELKKRNLELNAALGQTRPRSRFQWRAASSAAFLLFSVIVLIPASLLLWLNRTLIDPTTYLSTVSPVVQQPSVQKALTVTATRSIFQHVDVNKLVSENLPPKARFLSGPITTQVKNYTSQTIAGVVASPQFYRLWVNANTKAHALFLKLANNSRASPTINLGDLFTYIQSDLAHTALAPLVAHNLPPNIGNIPIATVPALVKIPHYVSELSALRWIFIALSVVFSIIAIALARSRRRALLGVGVVWVLSAALILAIVHISQVIMLADIRDPIYRAAAASIWPLLLRSLFTQLEVMTVIGLGTIIVAWILGPAKAATWMRHHSHTLLASSRTKWFPEIDDSQPVRFLQLHRRTGEWTILGISLLVLALMIPLTVNKIVSTAVGAIVLLLIFEFLAVSKKLPALPSVDK